MKNTILAIILLLVALQSQSSFAVKVNIIPDDSHQVIHPVISTWEDTQFELTPQQAIEKFNSDKFIENTKHTFMGRKSDTRYWFAMRLQSDGMPESAEKKILFLNNLPSSLLLLNLWWVDSNGVFSQPIRLEWNLQSSMHKLDELPFGIEIPAEMISSELTVIGYVENFKVNLPVKLEFKISDEQTYTDIAQELNVILIIFYSVMCGLFFYNLFLFVSLREMNYGLYLLFMLTALLVTSLMDGTLYLTEFLRSLAISKEVIVTSIVIVSINIYAGFVYYSLDKIHFWPMYFKIFKGIMLVSVLFIIGLPLFLSAPVIFAAYILIFSVFVLTFIAIVKGVLHAYTLAYYFLAAEMFFLLGTSLFTLQINGYIPSNNFTFYGLYWGIFTEALLLSFALASRTKTAITHELDAKKDALINQEKALEAFRMATTAKNEFIANVSHELRTPLTSVIGFTEMLVNKNNSQSQVMDFAQRILASAKDLEKTIDDILNISLIYSHKIKVKNLPCDIDLMLYKLQKNISAKAYKKSIGFNIDIDSNHSQYVLVDEQHLRQILFQLLDNAVKFTEKGKVSLHFSMDKSRQQMCFTITDTGCGIKPKKLDFLLEPFTQEDTSDSRLQSGTGVGMFLAKTLTELLKGEFKVESVVDVGTICKVILPYFPSENSLPHVVTEPKILVPRLTGNVLYAEDNVDNQDLVKILVEATGASLTIANNGKEAIELVLGLNNEVQFQLILMDIQMPIMDGIQALKILKENKVIIPVVAFSASAMSNNQTYISAGFDDFLTKPVLHEHLYQCLSNFLPVDESESDSSILVSESTFPLDANHEIDGHTEWDFSGRTEFMLQDNMSPLIIKFEAKLPVKIELLKTCFKNQKWVELASQLHQLKGSAGSYGHENLTQLCKQAETFLKNEKYAECQAVIYNMCDYLEKLKAYQ